MNRHKRHRSIKGAAEAIRDKDRPEVKKFKRFSSMKNVFSSIRPSITCNDLALQFRSSSRFHVSSLKTSGNTAHDSLLNEHDVNND